MFIFKSIELDYSSSLPDNNISNGIRKVELTGEKICIVEETSFTVFELSKIEKPTQTFIWRSKTNDEYILSGIWINKDFFLIVTNISIYTFKFDKELSINEFVIPFFSGKNILNVDIICINDNSYHKSDASFFLFALSSCSGLFLVSLSKNNLNFNISRLIEGINVGKLLYIEQYLYFTDSDSLYKYSIDVDNLQLILLDSINIGEFLRGSIGDNFRLLTTLNYNGSYTGSGEIGEFILILLKDEKKNLVIEFTISNTSLLPINISKISLNNNLIDLSILTVNNFKTYFITYTKKLTITNIPKSETEINSIAFCDFYTNFKPFVSTNIKSSNIVYVCFGKNENKNKWYLNLVEYDSQSITNNSYLNHKVFDTVIENDKNKLKAQLDKLLAFQNESLIPSNYILNFLNNLILISDENDHSYIAEYITNLFFFDYNEAKLFYFDLLQIVEKINQNFNIMSILNNLIHKLVTFNCIYSKNEQKTEFAINICNSEPLVFFKDKSISKWSKLWMKFIKCNIWKLGICFLSFGSIEEFFILFNRHSFQYGDSDEKIRSDLVLESLNNIPILIPEEFEKKFPSWLINQVFPLVLDKDRLLNWLADRATALEHITDGDINRCIFLLSSVFQSDLQFPINIQSLPRQIVTNGILWAGSGDKRHQIKKTSSRINKIYLSLIECLDIRENYNLDVGFNSLFHGKISPKKIVFTLLSRVKKLELLRNEIEKNIIPFCRQRGIESDFILLEYILEVSSLIQYSKCEGEKNVDNYSGIKAHFQSIIITLIDSISNDEYKSRALLQYFSVFNKYGSSLKSSEEEKYLILLKNNFEYLLNCAKNLKLDERKALELKNRISLIDAQNLLSRYNLDHMASVVLFEKNAPRRLLVHVISQVNIGIESFRDALSLLSYLERETNAFIMSITELFCIRLRFITFRKSLIQAINELSDKPDDIMSQTKNLEREILDLLSILDFGKRYSVTQQFTCFIWQFLDSFTVESYSLLSKIKCKLAVFSAIIVLREFLKFTQKNDIKLIQVTFWASNESFNTLLRLQALQVEFEIFLRPSDIMINKINHDQETYIEVDYSKINSVSISTLDDINSYSRNNSKFPTVHVQQNLKDWEWDSDYYHIYNESCYSKICEVFDQYSKAFIENNQIKGNKRGKLTKLLRLGNLIGVDESYVRRSLIRHSITTGNKLSIFKRLTQELVKSPSPKNAMIIIDEVQNIILYLHSIHLGEFKSSLDFPENQILDIDPFELSFIISELLQVLACCIPFCPTSVISFVLSLSGDILWVHDFLIQASDIIDNVECPESPSLLILHETEHIFTKILVNLFRRMNRKSVQINLKGGYYKEVSTLYPSDDAIIMALKFLANKITLRRELYRHISLKRAYISSLISVNFFVDPGWWPINYESDINHNISKVVETFKRYINTFLQQLYQFECLSLSISLYLRHPVMITDLSLVLNINVDFFRKVLKGKDPIDGQLCMALSSSLEKKNSWNVFVQSLTPSNILDNYYRAQRMARIGWDLGILYNHYSMRKEMEDLYKQSKWCNFFRQVCIDFDQSLFFQKQDYNNIHTEYKKNILQKIIFKNDFDIISCLKYANDYNINDEYVIKLWTEKMILYSNGYMFEQKMLNILNIITPELGKEIFNNTFNYIPSYNYERLFFILNWYYEKSKELSVKSLSGVKDFDTINSTCSSSTLVGKQILLHELSTKSKLEIVKILMTHKRVCGPDFDEKEFINNEIERLRERNQENWDEEMIMNLFSQRIYRIPFHYLTRFPLKALKYEITDETIYKMKLLSQNLGINKTAIDIQFVWNIVSCRKYRYYKDNNCKQIEEYSTEFENYYSNLIENDKILLRYIESIGSFDLEAGIAVVLLIIDELPLSITKIKLIEWYESKEDKYLSISLKKGYPLTKIDGINYSRNSEVFSNASVFLKSRKSLISTMLILERHKLNELFSNLLETTNDISHFIFTLYYYLIPLISEGFYSKKHNIVQKAILQTFCSNSDQVSPNFSDKYCIGVENTISNSGLLSRFNTFIDEISSVYSTEIRKVRISIVKNMLNKPFETPYDVVKNRFSNKIRVIFDKIDNSLLITGLENWFIKNESSFPNFYNKFLIDRIASICEGITSSDSILLLLSISFKNTTNYSFSTKCNALKTLFQIASTKSIQKKYPKYNDLKVIWLHNYYMIFFNQLHIPQDFSKFYLSEKVGLARSLWREYENRKLCDSVYLETKSKFYSEESRFCLSLKENECKNKMRCIRNENGTENLHLGHTSKTLSSSITRKHNELNIILYLIAEMCIDFGINDSKLFSNTILNLYKQLYDENDAKLLRNILFASYKSGFIYCLPLKKILIDSWSFLFIDPISSLQTLIDDFLNNFWNANFYEDKSSEISLPDLKLLLKSPINHYFITFFSYICDDCPITPFINIYEYINALTNLYNSIFNLMTSINSKNTSDQIRNSSLSIIDFTVTFFTSFSKEFFTYDKPLYSENIKHSNKLRCEDIITTLEILLYRLTSLIIRPIDLHIDIHSPEKNRVIKKIIENLVSHELYPYFVYSSSSSFFISSLLSEFLKMSTPNNFFETGNKFIGFIDQSKKKYIENLFLVSCISSHYIYEYIECKGLELEVKEYVLIIEKCIKYYGIESVIPYIIRFLSGETNSENEILERLRFLERCYNKTK
ncbi:hypothetical protein FG386_003219 [Cryptosporidium ryanae]|uniref:uncharacterized protein n=1 Tax=Cryptosporidium ryanae TaxID=515981 RepID=UPI00351A6DCB|nr:hypothetical protein FG386_003219 [Cryptosporidium ryanae]